MLDFAIGDCGAFTAGSDEPIRNLDALQQKDGHRYYRQWPALSTGFSRVRHGD
jgi:hypothetical protein